MKLLPTVIYGFSNGSMTLDASVEEAHEVTATITKHPIEFGANISDHMIIEPRSFVLKGRISNAPLRTYSGDVLTGATNRAAQAWTELQSLMFEKSSVTIDTGLKQYENLVLESLRSAQDWKTSGVLDFEAVFREIFIVGVPTYSEEATTAQVVPDGASEEEAAKRAQFTFALNRGQVTAKDLRALSTVQFVNLEQ